MGEFRAVAERLLETGAQYLEQGREWLHAATRGHPGERRTGHGDTRLDGHRRTFGDARSRGRNDASPYAPDEYSFSETGGVFDPYGGRRDKPPGFETELDESLHRRARPGGFAAGARRRPGAQRGERDDDGFLPGSYGFGGEGRHEPGGSPDDHHQAASDDWERACRAQGRGNYRGRGPRGYVRPDERILEEVNERLCDDAIVDATDIEVHCDKGRVILEGRVPTRWMKHRAEDIADAVRGARDIDNRIRVSAEAPAPRGDFDTRRTTAAPDAMAASPREAAATSAVKDGQSDAPRDQAVGATPKPPQSH